LSTPASTWRSGSSRLEEAARADDRTDVNSIAKLLTATVPETPRLTIY
jgi:hypothetical protein